AFTAVACGHRLELVEVVARAEVRTVTSEHDGLDPGAYLIDVAEQVVERLVQRLVNGVDRWSRQPHREHRALELPTKVVVFHNLPFVVSNGRVSTACALPRSERAAGPLVVNAFRAREAVDEGRLLGAARGAARR